MPLLIFPVQYDTNHSSVVMSFIAPVDSIITINLNFLCNWTPSVINTHDGKTAVTLMYFLISARPIIVINNSAESIEQKQQLYDF